jgi:two-component system cell cycle sensor histidine kinase/response regulator CckA
MANNFTNAILRIVLPYVVFASAWILLSDEMLALLSADPAFLLKGSIYKGLAFVIVTAVLLGFLIRRDLEARERSDSALRKSEHLQRTIYENVLDLIWMKDLGGKVLTANKAFCDFFKREPENVIGKSNSDLFPPETAAEFDRYDRTAVESRRPWHGEKSAPGGEAGPLCFETVLIPVIDQKEGGVTGTIGIARDITWRKKSEAVLMESERRFRELLENVGLLAVILDMAGEVEFCNESFLAATGWEKAEVIGQNWFEQCLPKDERESLQSKFAEALSANQIINRLETSLCTRGGKIRTIIWDNTLLRTLDGRICGIALLGRDITAQIQMETQLRQAQKMEALGRLAGGVAHDFNNILQSMQSAAEFLSMGLDPEHPSHAELKEMFAAVERAQSLTRQLLMFSRRGTPQKKILELHPLVAGMSKMLCRMIGTHVQLTTAEKQGALYINADPGQVEQALMNLCVNARDAMPKGGEITITTGLECVSGDFVQTHPWAHAGNYAALTVSDTGCGIPAEQLGRIFDPFFTTKEVGRGTGLGLPAVYSIVKQHGGFIEVESQVGRGTRFQLYFPPALDSIEQGTIVPANSPAAGANETILLAEDDEQIRTMASRLLQRGGYQVLAARDGEEAIAVFEARQAEIKLVLLDVIMPKLGGKAAAIQIRQISPTVPILHISGYAFAELEKEMAPTMPHQLLRKPFTREELLRKVREMLDNRESPAGE